MIFKRSCFFSPFLVPRQDPIVKCKFLLLRHSDGNYHLLAILKSSTRDIFTHCLSLSLSVSLLVCLCFYLSICIILFLLSRSISFLSFFILSLSVCLFFSLSFCLSFWMSVSICLSVRYTFYLLLLLSICLCLSFFVLISLLYHCQLSPFFFTLSIPRSHLFLLLSFFVIFSLCKTRFRQIGSVVVKRYLFICLVADNRLRQT
jgi:hypothetical protein